MLSSFLVKLKLFTLFILGIFYVSSIDSYGQSALFVDAPTQGLLNLIPGSSCEQCTVLDKSVYSGFWSLDFEPVSLPARDLKVKLTANLAIQNSVRGDNGAGGEKFYKLSDFGVDGKYNVDFEFVAKYTDPNSNISYTTKSRVNLSSGRSSREHVFLLDGALFSSKWKDIYYSDVKAFIKDYKFQITEIKAIRILSNTWPMRMNQLVGFEIDKIKKKNEFQEVISLAEKKENSGNLEEAIVLYKKALQRNNSPEIEKKIAELKERLNSVQKEKNTDSVSAKGTTGIQAQFDEIKKEEDQKADAFKPIAPTRNKKKSLAQDQNVQQFIERQKQLNQTIADQRRQIADAQQLRAQKAELYAKGAMQIAMIGINYLNKMEAEKQRREAYAHEKKMKLLIAERYQIVYDDINKIEKLNLYITELIEKYSSYTTQRTLDFLKIIQDASQRNIQAYEAEIENLDILQEQSWKHVEYRKSIYSFRKSDWLPPRKRRHASSYTSAFLRILEENKYINNKEDRLSYTDTWYQLLEKYAAIEFDYKSLADAYGPYKGGGGNVATYLTTMLNARLIERYAEKRKQIVDYYRDEMKHINSTHTRLVYSNRGTKETYYKPFIQAECLSQTLKVKQEKRDNLFEEYKQIRKYMGVFWNHYNLLAPELFYHFPNPNDVYIPFGKAQFSLSNPYLNPKDSAIVEIVVPKGSDSIVFNANNYVALFEPKPFIHHFTINLKPKYNPWLYQNKTYVPTHFNKYEGLKSNKAEFNLAIYPFSVAEISVHAFAMKGILLKPYYEKKHAMSYELRVAKLGGGLYKSSLSEQLGNEQINTILNGMYFNFSLFEGGPGYSWASSNGRLIKQVFAGINLMNIRLHDITVNYESTADGKLQSLAKYTEIVGGFYFDIGVDYKLKFNGFVTCHLRHYLNLYGYGFDQLEQEVKYLPRFNADHFSQKYTRAFKNALIFSIIF